MSPFQRFRTHRSHLSNQLIFTTYQRFQRQTAYSEKWVEKCIYPQGRAVPKDLSRRMGSIVQSVMHQGVDVWMI